MNEQALQKKHYLPLLQVRLLKDGSLKSDRRIIRSPSDAFSILQPFFDELPCEHFVTVLLTTKNRIIAVSPVSIGSLNASIVHPRELFQRAILCNSASILLAHNHPSGDPTPSREDIQLTKQLGEAGKILDICIVDHIIIGENSYVSLKERGLM